MAADLDIKIANQIEYYFGDYNLPKDKFMRGKIEEDDGWITLEVLLTFKRLANLSTDPEVIVKAVEKSENKLVEISEDRKKLRRNPEKPLPEWGDEQRKEVHTRTAYAKGFPKDETLDNLKTFFEPHGPVVSIQMRTCNDPATKTHKFKGSCFITFTDVETCKKFVEQDGIKYNDSELVRKMHQQYWADKKEELAERKNKKQKKVANNNVKDKEMKKLEIPKGSVLHFKGIKEGQSLTREDIKDKILEAFEMETAFLDFKKFDSEGYIRMRKENEGSELHQKSEGKLAIGEVTLELRLIEGEEEEEYLKRAVEAVMEIRQQKRGKKRRGQFGGDGPRNKARH